LKNIKVFTVKLGGAGRKIGGAGRKTLMLKVLEMLALMFKLGP